jgi:hypothetical protein
MTKNWWTGKIIEQDPLYFIDELILFIKHLKLTNRNNDNNNFLFVS